MNALYLHIPFCTKKCLYCSFCVFVGQLNHADRYLRCLEEEAAGHSRERMKTVYVGGGTPSLLKSRHCEFLLSHVLSRFDLSQCEEFSFEMNPEDVDRAKAECLLSLGVDRVSLGVQTFHDGHLKRLGRCHDASAAFRAYDTLREAGFDHVSVDLMTGLPGQTPQELKKDIMEIERMACDHVSVYALSVEPRSHFFVQKVKLSDEEALVQQHSRVCGLLNDAGYGQYEISNFAKPGKESLHNINYWKGGNYLGLGVSAHSHVDGRRYWNVGRLKDYMDKVESEGNAKGGEEVLSPEMRLSEALLFGLRMNEGVDVGACEQRFECCLNEEQRQKIEQFKDQGWLEQQGNMLKATASGRLVLDELAGYLV